jgi:putative Mg2+ transporter-C (MgtC) family protein
LFSSKIKEYNSMMIGTHFSIDRQTLFHVGMQILCALVCGGAIGLERELKNKSAGIKTNMLICMGATLYTAASTLIASQVVGGGPADPSRIAAQIVSGIGFLGGGTIIQSKGSITGLTTAATIWVVAAIGVCIGMNYPGVAIVWTFSVLLVLILTSIFEDRILGRTLSFTCIIVISDPAVDTRQSITQTLAENELVLSDFNMSSNAGLSTMTLHYMGHRRNNRKFILDLWHIAGIREVRQG